MRTETAVVAGRQVRYLLGGNPNAARTLLLVHAFPVGVGTWEPQVDAFPGWRVLVPALPGFDGSDLVAEPSVETYAAHIAGFMSATRAERAVIGGLSMGGYVALALWRSHPAAFSGLLLADTRSGPDSEQARAARHEMLATLAAGGPAAVAGDVLPKLLGAQTREHRPEVVEFCRARIVSQPAAAIDGAVRALMSRPDAGPVLSTITVPTLIVVGEDDVLTPPAEAEQLQRGITASSLVRIRGAGHLSSLEHPAAFNQAMTAFLESIA